MSTRAKGGRKGPLVYEWNSNLIVLLFIQDVASGHFRQTETRYKFLACRKMGAQTLRTYDMAVFKQGPSLPAFTYNGTTCMNPALSKKPTCSLYSVLGNSYQQQMSRCHQ